jgi:hypothetical protein
MPTEMISDRPAPLGSFGMISCGCDSHGSEVRKMEDAPKERPKRLADRVVGKRDVCSQFNRLLRAASSEMNHLPCGEGGRCSP